MPGSETELSMLSLTSTSSTLDKDIIIISHYKKDSTPSIKTSMTLPLSSDTIPLRPYLENGTEPHPDKTDA